MATIKLKTIMSRVIIKHFMVGCRFESASKIGAHNISMAFVEVIY